ncbi:hypothetical protein [Salidesulfovibrio brasiliensis]
MSNLKDYADGLQQDVVSEMAEHYFGARKNLESMIEVLQEWAEELRFKEGRVLAAAGNLHALLIDEKTVRDFYMSLDIVPACVPPFEESLKATNMDRVPFALTRKGRWTKCVKEAYHGLSKATDTYLNGTYYTDEEGRKRLTVHYIRLKAMVQYVNEEVIRVNEDMSPSEALRYIKNMDPEYVAKEELVNPCMPSEGCALDSDLRFSSIDMDAFGLMELQELPHLIKVEQQIEAFCSDVYPEKRQAVAEILEKIKSA